MPGFTRYESAEEPVRGPRKERTAVNNFTNLALWIIIAVLLVLLFNLFQNPGAGRATRSAISFTEFVQQVIADQVKSVTESGHHIEGQFQGGTPFSTDFPDDPGLTQRMREHNVDIKVAQEDNNITLLSVLINWFPMLLFVGVMIFLMRQMQASGGKAMGFGKSRAKMLTERQGRVTFEDVAGVDEAKDDLVEIVDFLKDPQKFQKLGGRIPKGVLLVGPPGTGKNPAGACHRRRSQCTLLHHFRFPTSSKCSSASAPAWCATCSNRPRRTRPASSSSMKSTLSGRHRGAGLGGGNDEREQTLNQLLVEMDGFEANEGVILIAATNRPDVLDPALLRPGRFDRQIVVPNPDLSGREKILKVHMRKVPLSPDVDPRVIARGTPGFSGADLANLVNEAALLTARRGKRLVGRAEFEDAKDKVMMGAERRSLAMSEEEKKLTAYHESGHALVALNVVGSDPIHKATIIPRGRALGMVMRLPERDQVSLTRQKLNADLCVAFGGRIAEELIFGYDKVTTGAQSDIRNGHPHGARHGTARFGMSDELGPISYGENQEEVFLGHSVSRTQSVSEATAQKIDSEVRRIVEETYSRAKQMLTEKVDELHIVAKGLLEYETLTGDEIKGLLKGERPVRTPYEEPEPQTTRPTATVPPAGRSRGEGPGIGLSPEPATGDLTAEHLAAKDLTGRFPSDCRCVNQPVIYRPYSAGGFDAFGLFIGGDGCGALGSSACGHSENVTSIPVPGGGTITTSNNGTTINIKGADGQTRPDDYRSGRESRHAVLCAALSRRPDRNQRQRRPGRRQGQHGDVQDCGPGREE